MVIILTASPFNIYWIKIHKLVCDWFSWHKTKSVYFVIAPDRIHIPFTKTKTPKACLYSIEIGAVCVLQLHEAVINKLGEKSCSSILFEMIYLYLLLRSNVCSTLCFTKFVVLTTSDSLQSEYMNVYAAPTYFYKKKNV